MTRKQMKEVKHLVVGKKLTEKPKMQWKRQCLISVRFSTK